MLTITMMIITMMMMGNRTSTTPSKIESWPWDPRPDPFQRRPWGTGRGAVSGSGPKGFQRETNPGRGHCAPPSVRRAPLAVFHKVHHHSGEAPYISVFTAAAEHAPRRLQLRLQNLRISCPGKAGVPRVNGTDGKRLN